MDTLNHRPGRTTLLLFALSLAAYACADGAVADDKGPVAKASVGWQGQRERVASDDKGRFRLPPVADAPGSSKRAIATKPGYRIASALLSDNPLMLKLQRLPKDDNADYEWIDPHADRAKPNNCANCHGVTYREWKDSAHA